MGRMVLNAREREAFAQKLYEVACEADVRPIRRMQGPDTPWKEAEEGLKDVWRAVVDFVVDDWNQNR